MLIAFACALIGALCLYLGSPNQTWLPAPIAACPARIAAVLACAAALWRLCQVMQVLAACYVFLTALMLLLLALPYCGALLRSLKGAANHD